MFTGQKGKFVHIRNHTGHFTAQREKLSTVDTEPAFTVPDRWSLTTRENDYFAMPVCSVRTRWQRNVLKGPYVLCPVFQQPPQGYPPTCVSVGLAEHNRLVGLVVKASALKAEDPEFESRLR